MTLIIGVTSIWYGRVVLKHYVVGLYKMQAAFVVLAQHYYKLRDDDTMGHGMSRHFLIFVV